MRGVPSGGRGLRGMLLGFVCEIDDEGWIEGWIGIVDVGPRVGEDAGFADGVVLGVVDVAVDPEERFVEFDEGVEVGGVGAADGILFAVVREGTHGGGMVGDDHRAAGVARIQELLDVAD